MRYGTLFTLMALTGCAHVSRLDQQTGLEIQYTGSAKGAVDLVYATDLRPYEMAREAMDKGMSTSLARDADGDVRFNASYGGYTYGGSVGGFAPANTGFIPGQGFVTGPPVSTLPTLATSVVTGMPQGQAGSIVPCPGNRERATPAEQSACNEQAIDALYRARTR